MPSNRQFGFKVNMGRLVRRGRSNSVPIAHSMGNACTLDHEGGKRPGLLELVDEHDTPQTAETDVRSITNENSHLDRERCGSNPSLVPLSPLGSDAVPSNTRETPASPRSVWSPNPRRRSQRRAKSDLSGLLGACKSPSLRRSWRVSHRRAPSTSGDDGPEDRPTSSSQSANHPHPGDVLKMVRHGSAKVTNTVGTSLGRVLRSIEEFLFPRMTLDSGNQPISSTATRVLGGIRLKGCETDADHRDRVQHCVAVVRQLHGEAGLRELGLEYRLLACEVHRPIIEEQSSSDDGDAISSSSKASLSAPTFSSSPRLTSLSRNITDSMRSASVESVVDVAVSLPSPDDLDEADFDPATEADFASGMAHRCHLCMRRLYDIESNTLIVDENRKLYIADGDMYEEVARLCQEYAHDVMCQEGHMDWVAIEPDGANRDNHQLTIRAIINNDHPLIAGTDGNPMANRPSLVIATGRGKVRAGVFSRQHLICSGLESATAVPIVREALLRRLNIIVIDPNIHGESQGFVVFEKTMDYLLSLSKPESEDDLPLTARDLYVLSHSASGGHLARYLLDKSEHCLPHIRAIAFTDSTHNIQWARTHNNDPLHELLESPKCVYFRSSKVRVEDQRQWYLHRAGEEIATDTFWQHRFGRIRTFWAGTNEHSMTNWYAHAKIWEHFDSYLKSDGCKGSPGRSDTIGSGAAPAARSPSHDPSSTGRNPGKVMLL